MKTYKECCSEVAIKYGVGKSLVIGHRPKYWEEAAEIYASQWKPTCRLDLKKISANIDKVLDDPNFAQDFKKFCERDKKND